MVHWDGLPGIDRNTAVLQEWLSQSDQCVCGRESPAIIGDHLRLCAGEGCLEGVVSGCDE